MVISVILFFLKAGSFSESSVELKIDAPSEIKSGDLETYKVTLNNKSQVDLSEVKMTAIYPTDSIVSKDGDIMKVNTENIDLGTVNTKTSVERELTAYIVGDRGNVKNFKISITYKAGKLSSTFQKDVTLATTINTLSVPITLVATPTIIAGQTTSYLLDYRNQSDQDLSNLRFLVKYPTGFTATKFSPQYTSHMTGQDSWDIESLKQGDGSRITIQGILNGKERETKTVSVTLQKKITTPSGDVYVDFEKSEASSVISTPPLSLDVSVNDSSDYIAHLGDTLRYKLTFHNNSGADLTGLTLSANLNGNMYDFSTVKSDGFFDGRLNTITWNASTTPLLNSLANGQSGVISFEVHLKPNFSGSMGASDSFIKSSAHIETPNVPSQLDLDKLSADDELVTRISTAPTFDQKLLVKDSVFGPSGPFPPKVNQKTTFTIRWNLLNPSSDVTQAKISATLAPGVDWENRVRVNGTLIQPTYNTRQNSVVWDLGTLPGGAGINTPSFETYFQISITPSVNQAGDSVQLMKNVRFDGVDSFTKEKISRTISDIGTSNTNDSNAGGSVQQ